MPDPLAAAESQTAAFKSESVMNLRLPGDYLRVLAKLPGVNQLQNFLLGFFSLLSRQEGQPLLVEAFILRDALQGPVFQDDSEAYAAALKAALDQGFLLIFSEPVTGMIYLLPGTPQGQALLAALEEGSVSAAGTAQAQPTSLEPTPNTYQLYEEHFGPLTPLLAEELRQDEAAYPAEWIPDAIREALLHNARSWKYVQAVLKNWKEHGKGPAHEKSKERDRETEKYLEALKKRKQNR